jgi:hypothetical protein
LSSAILRSSSRSFASNEAYMRVCASNIPLAKSTFDSEQRCRNSAGSEAVAVGPTGDDIQERKTSLKIVR